MEQGTPCPQWPRCGCGARGFINHKESTGCGKMKMSKKFELKANDKNLLSTCVGLIITILTEKRGAKYFDSFEATFNAFQERVKIPPELWKTVAKGVPKWQQAIRNASKVHIRKRTPDALTQIELMALVDGGFALPHTVPPGRKVVEFPNIGGLKMPKLKIPKRKTLAADEAWQKVARLSRDDVARKIDRLTGQIGNIVKHIDPRIRSGLVKEIYSRIHNGEWDFADGEI